MDALYFFIAAAVIASFGISITLRSSMEKLVLQPESLQKIQSKFFINVAIIEVIPIIMIVFGFITLMDSTINVIIPIVIVCASMLINFAMNVMKMSALESQAPDLKEKLMTFFLMGNVLMTAIPIVAIVATFIR